MSNMYLNFIEEQIISWLRNEWGEKKSGNEREKETC